MRIQNRFRFGIIVPALLFISGLSFPATAQVSSPPSANCHITDGKFDVCTNGQVEWSDVQPVNFPTDGFLYVNQDPKHSFLYLMYDFPFRTTDLAATDSVHINFDTIETESGTPALIVYDVYIYGNGKMQVLQQGQPTPPGSIVGAVGFGTSPNSATAHVIAELQVPLAAGLPPSTYSSDPLAWTTTLPPSPPPDPCPKASPDKTYNTCQTKQANQMALIYAETGIAIGVAAYTCTTFTALLCAPLEPAMFYTSAVYAAAAAYAAYIAGDPLGLVLTIPPDPNYTTIATPGVYSLSVPTGGLSAAEASALTAIVTNLEQFVALEQAQITSVARSEGANIAGSPTWVINQIQAAQNFAAQAGAILSAQSSLEATLTAAITASGVDFTFTPNDIVTVQSYLRTKTFPPEVAQDFALALQAFSQLNVSDADQANALTLMTSADPNAVTTLGTGVFPQALSDPAVATVEQQFATGLLQSQPPSTSLSQSFNVTLEGDYVASGVGLRGGTAPSYGPPPATGPIKISGIPAGATVVRAFLYWGMLDNGLELSLGQLNINGQPVIGSLIGSGPDTCWGRSNSFTFRADVTPLVTGNGTYTLSDFATGGNILSEGASLVVIYQLAGAPTKTIILDDGNISIPQGTSTGTASFSGFTTVGTISATTTFMVGDGQEQQGFNTAATFTGNLGTLSFPGLFAANDGPLWDSDTFNVSSLIGVGNTSDSATVTLVSDCVLWSAQAFSVTSAPITAPVTATSGVVESGTNGDTSVNLRGLGPNDTPTLQDQIAMVVQFRTIQNPSISGSALTNQLVTGLVNDGVISSGDANTIESAVVKSLVTPVGPPAISGAIASPTVTPSANVEVNVTFTDTGTGNAVNAALNQITLKTLVGSGTVTLNTPSLPIAIGNLAVGASSTVKLFLNVPSTVKRFTITETGTVQDILNRPFTYSTSQTVF
jgi:hypothetical protein